MILMKKSFLTLTIIFLIFQFNLQPSDKARGLFAAIGVGTRLPIFEFSKSTFFGFGVNGELAYTDNEFLPIFLFGKVGIEHYPASQDFYQISDYSHFSTTFLPFSFGGRYYFPALLENIVLVLPMLEVSTSVTFFQKLHQFKPTAHKSNFTEDGIKIGGNVGVGISMFMMEILFFYNYYPENQFLGADIKVRLPLFINL